MYITRTPEAVTSFTSNSSKMMKRSPGAIGNMRWIALILIVSSFGGLVKAASSDYGQALALSFEFFEAQRSGYLPSNSRVTWRFNSALHDGLAQGIDLVGGYYDAGDNVKFGFPMAFTITTLSWSVVAYQAELQQQGQLQTALDSIKWGTDYFIKAHPEANVLWAEVGDGTSDHYCWERPEDMTTSRQAYQVDASNPGSEVAAETAAAMAAASIAFSSVDPSYSSTLLTHAKELFTFADTYRGHYDDAIPVVKPFYPSGPSGYNDELLWAAGWLFEATNDQSYLDYFCNNAQAMGGDGWGITEFGWDVKYAGVQVLATKILLEGRGGPYTSILQDYKTQAEFFMCAVLGQNSGANIARSPGGMLFTQAWNNMQFVIADSFLVTYYSDLMSTNNGQLSCSGNIIQPTELLNLGQSQADYILGNNPKGMSYMVGYSNNYPLHVHHRGASEPSIQVDTTQDQCLTGYSTWFSSPNPNPNTLVGAVVGGPDESDNYVDSRSNFEGGEACVYNNALLVGLLARLAGGAPSSVSYTDPATLPPPPPSVATPSPPPPVVATPSPPHPDAPHPSVPTQSPPHSEAPHPTMAPHHSEALHPSMAPHHSKSPHHSVTHVQVAQHLVASWKANGVDYYKYAGVLSNGSDRTLKNFVMTFETVQGPVYGLSRIGGSTSFTFPGYPTSLMPGETLHFVYITLHATPVHISIHDEKFV